MFVYSEEINMLPLHGTLYCDVTGLVLSTVMEISLFDAGMVNNCVCSLLFPISVSEKCQMFLIAIFKANLSFHCVLCICFAANFFIVLDVLVTL